MRNYLITFYAADYRLSVRFRAADCVDAWKYADAIRQPWCTDISIYCEGEA